MSKISLRPATEDDEGFVMMLTRGEMWPYVVALFPDAESLAEYYRIERFVPEETQIILCDGKGIGRVSIKREEKRLYLDEIHLLPDYQRKGIGTRVIERILAEGREKHLPVDLTVLTSSPAQTLYERLGFREVWRNDKRRGMRGMSRELPLLQSGGSSSTTTAQKKAQLNKYVQTS